MRRGGRWGGCPRLGWWLVQIIKLNTSTVGLCMGVHGYYGNWRMNAREDLMNYVYLYRRDRDLQPPSRLHEPPSLAATGCMIDACLALTFLFTWSLENAQSTSSHLARRSGVSTRLYACAYKLSPGNNYYTKEQKPCTQQEVVA